ncbi:protein kinase [Knoellia sinensis KCTC 19936]|uniref:non-specific serine/threonine protein kinase n=1 Tax=Knoellia sinensis KCTC 19936 TaxID=1385520 RepID=A0A0A0J9C0_9MICO|nr:protein kinase [Knoellia sinensis KCTC 19936]
MLGGRYRLGAPLGRGGMAVVWRADDELLGREVAVKTLDLTGPDSDNAGQRFNREARATAMLNHPNIVTVYDTGVEDHTAYLVMELLPGPTLAERVREEGTLPVEDVRTIGHQVAVALQAAHDAGIVHRDIKPGNIAYGADGTVKVLDFGITQIVDEALGHHHQLTMTNTIVGTAEYLAPEQATGQRVDARADLYALGCVLTTLLTGYPPFTAPTPVAILMKHANEPARDVRELRPDTPQDLADLIAGLLAKDPAHRPQTGRDVAEMLRSRWAPAPTEVLAPAVPAAATTQFPATGPVPSGSGPVDEPYYEEDYYPQRQSRGWMWLFVFLAAAIAAVGLYLLLGNGSDDPTDSPTGSTTPTTTPTQTTEPSTPTPTPSETTSTPAPIVTITETPPRSETPTPSETVDTGQAVTDASAAMGDAVRRAQGQALDPEVAETVLGWLEDVDQAVQDGDGPAARSKVDDIQNELAQALEDGKLTPEGQATLDGPLANLQSAAEAFRP